MAARKIKEAAKSLGTEFRGAVIKAVVTPVVLAVGAFLLSEFQPAQLFFAKTFQISNLGIVLDCVASSLGAAFFTFVFFWRHVRRLRAELLGVKELAALDDTTQLLNSNQINPYLSKRVDQAKLDSSVFSLIMVDIDNFKRINDSYTHSTGNYILRQVADQLPGRSRGDTTFRWGGDEFLILSKTTNVKNEGHGFAERIRKEIAAFPFLVERNTHRRESITVSCGVTEYNVDDSFDDLKRRVTKALQLAKQPRVDPDGVERSKNFVYVSYREEESEATLKLLG